MGYAINRYVDGLLMHQRRAVHFRRIAHNIRPLDPYAARQFMTNAVLNMHMVRIYLEAAR